MIIYKKIIIPVLVLCGCSTIDNYDEPNGAIHGKLIDDITQAGLQTEQPNGFNIKLFEKGGAMNSPIIFSGKPDGTFENAWIFQNEYKVLPDEGAFFPVDTLNVQIGARTELDFTVTPFLAVINTAVQASEGKIVSTYQIARSIEGEKIIERKTLVSRIPTVNNAIFDAQKESLLNDIPDYDVLNSSFTDEIEVAPGEYYVRVAVCTDNSLKKYNYSEVFKVSVP